MSVIKTLAVSLVARTSGFGPALKGAARDVRAVGASMTNTQAVFAGGAAGIAAGAVALAASLAQSLGRALVGVTRDAIAFAQTTTQLAGSTGLSTERVAALSVAAEQTGQSVQTVVEAAAELQRGGILSPEQANALAPVLGHLQQGTRDAQQFGLALSAVEGEQLQGMVGAFTRLGQLLQGVVLQFLVEIAPYVTAAVNGFLDWLTAGEGVRGMVSGVMGYLQSIGDFFAGAYQLIEPVIETVGWLVQGFADLMYQALEVTGVLGLINQGIEYVGQVWDGIWISINASILSVQMHVEQFMGWWTGALATVLEQVDRLTGGTLGQEARGLANVFNRGAQEHAQELAEAMSGTLRRDYPAQLREWTAAFENGAAAEAEARATTVNTLREQLATESQNATRELSSAGGARGAGASSPLAALERGSAEVYRMLARLENNDRESAANRQLRESQRQTRLLEDLVRGVSDSGLQVASL